MELSLDEEDDDEDDYGEDSDDRTTLNNDQDSDVNDPSLELRAKSPREMLLSKDNSFVIDSERHSSSDSREGLDLHVLGENTRQSDNQHAPKPPKKGSFRAITRLEQIEKSKRQINEEIRA